MVMKTFTSVPKFHAKLGKFVLLSAFALGSFTDLLKKIEDNYSDYTSPGSMSIITSELYCLSIFVFVGASYYSWRAEGILFH